MRALTVGRLLSFDIPLAGVEGIKWFALVCMLQEHVLRFVFDAWPLWSYALGRLAFPLFAIALCKAVDTRSELKVIQRLVAWALVSHALRFGFDLQPEPLNILFTFALGLAGASFWWLGGRWVAASAVCVALGAFVEYGMLGVLFVLSLRVFFVRLSASVLVLAVAALWLSQQAYMPLVAFVVAPIIAAAVSDVPRVRGLFYWVYALQWPLIAGLRYAF